MLEPVSADNRKQISEKDIWPYSMLQVQELNY